MAYIIFHSYNYVNRDLLRVRNHWRVLFSLLPEEKRSLNRPGGGLLTAWGMPMLEPASRRDFLIGTASVTALTITGCGEVEPTSVQADPGGDPANFPAGDRPATNPETGPDAAACAGATAGLVVGPAATDIGLNQAKPVVIAQGQPKPTYMGKSLNLYVCRDNQGLVGVDVTCTHLGCLPDFVHEQGAFRCKCHGSLFSINGGLVNGPAMRPLPRFAACKGSDGLVRVDISKALP